MTAAPPPAIATQVVVDESFVAAVVDSDPLAAETTITLDDLRHRVLIGQPRGTGSWGSRAWAAAGAPAGTPVAALVVAAPVVGANMPDRLVNGVRQVRMKIGTVGQPLPGVAIRVVDPETEEPRSFGESGEGLVMVTGPSGGVNPAGDPLTA